MIQLLKWLFIGHIHKWKTLSDGPLTIISESGKQVGLGRRYIQQCDHCGVVVKRDLA